MTQTATFRVNKDIYDRREQRAIGHFIDMVEWQSKQNNEMIDDAMKGLSRESTTAMTERKTTLRTLTVWAMTTQDKVILPTICATKKDTLAENYNLFGTLGRDYIPRKFTMTEVA